VGKLEWTEDTDGAKGRFWLLMTHVGAVIAIWDDIDKIMKVQQKLASRYKGNATTTPKIKKGDIQKGGEGYYYADHLYLRWPKAQFRNWLKKEQFNDAVIKFQQDHMVAFMFGKLSRTNLAIRWSTRGRIGGVGKEGNKVSRESIVKVLIKAHAEGIQQYEDDVNANPYPISRSLSGSTLPSQVTSSRGRSLQSPSKAVQERTSVG
jgi:hypothetical protein